MPNWDPIFEEWSKGPTQAEQDRTTRIAREISDALKSYPKLQSRKIEVFPQGSFANRVNIRRESDVDVCALHPTSISMRSRPDAQYTTTYSNFIRRPTSMPNTRTM